MDDYWDLKQHTFETLLGKTLERVEVSEDKREVRFATIYGEVFLQYHSQDCCESVSVEDVVGDLADLIGSPLLVAEAVSSSGGSDYEGGDYDKRVVTGEWPEGVPVPEYVDDSWTWTFYKLATVKGSVTIRWFGSSNGYYSESVSFVKLGERA